MGDEAVTMRERIAKAANAGNLNPDVTLGISHTDVLGALGASTHMRVFDDHSRRMVARVTSVGTPVFHPGRRLAVLLGRAKYGMDRAAFKPAVLLFADLLHSNKATKDWRRGSGDALLLRYASRLVQEWLNDKCPQCGGAGRVLIGRPGRNALTRQCGVCRGLARVKLDTVARAQAIGVGVDVYERHWAARFTEGARLLLEFEESNSGVLRSQLKAGNVAPSR